MARMGSQKLAVFLCKLSDTESIEPHPSSFYNELFAQRGTKGLNDYWIAASQGAINLDGTTVFGWRTINQTLAAFQSAFPGRQSKVQAAINAFPEVDTSTYAGVVAMFNVDVGDAGTQGGVLASHSGDADSVTFLGHETGHVFGLDHSFDQSSRQDEPWSAPGEYYDQYDIMSAMNTFSTSNARFGKSGPLLCAANLDRMGWLPPNRVWTPTGSNSSFTDQFDLVSLSHPETPGYLAANISGLYIEFRTVENWDAALPRPGVLLHRMYDPNAVILASDKASFVNDWQPGQTFGATDEDLSLFGGVQIKILSFDLAHKKARIQARGTAQRQRVVGPAHIFGGVASDGGGGLFINGRYVKIPPRSPIMLLAEEMANFIEAEERTAMISTGLGILKFQR